jgi:hypothetical protein
MNATMNTGGKHDFHPDAESLSAFAEQALSGRERGQVLAHLAVCGRCRQVVALAREAGLDAEVRPAAAERAAIQPYAWWRSWRFAWIPAAALAATVTLAVFVHMRHVEQSAEMAKNERERVTQAAATPAYPAQQERAQPAPPAAAPEAVKSPARASKRASEGMAPRPPSQEPVVTAAIPAAPGAVEQSEGAREEAAPPSAAAGLGFAGAGPAAERPTAAYTPEPAVDAWQQERQQKVAAGAAQRHLYAARTPAPGSVRGTDGGAAGSSTEQVTVSSPQIEKQAQPAPRPAAPMPSGTLVNPDGAAKRIYLPSGLRVESMAAAGPRMLAIDTAGALFVSEDSGDTWERVTPQWTGRAVKVRRQMASSGMEAVPTKFFELLNDQSQVWLSTDGMTWTAK